MADELSLRVNATLTNGDRRELFDRQAIFDQATNLNEIGDQIVGITHEALRLGDVSTASVVILRNDDDTNFVQVGREIAAVFEEFADIAPGGIVVLKIPAGVTYYVQADTAPCTLQRFIPSA